MSEKQPQQEKAKTPMMQQWYSCKNDAKDALLLFRLGDFYEAFYDDAKVLAETLDVVLTKRQNIPMSGIPVQSLEHYLQKLMDQNHVVAIAEQTEDPKATKGIVDRKVTRIVSPATYVPQTYDAPVYNSFFASIYRINQKLSLALADVTTGELILYPETTLEHIFDELVRSKPKEVLLSKDIYSGHEEWYDKVQYSLQCKCVEEPSSFYDYDVCKDIILKELHIHTLQSIGLEHDIPSVCSLGGLLFFLKFERCLELSELLHLSIQKPEEYLMLDHITLHHLEIHKDSSASLFSILNHCQTAMGKRKLYSSLIHPLLNIETIRERHECIHFLTSQDGRGVLHSSSEHTKSIRDIEKIVMKLSSRRHTPKDLTALKASLENVLMIKNVLKSQTKAPELIQTLSNSLNECSELIDLLTKAILDDAPLRLGTGRVIKEGFNNELDQLYELKNNSKQVLLNYQNELRLELGIKTLKVSFNKAFGYFIEVSKGQAEKMPSGFERRQTLVNNERFISPKLKQFEEDILSAESKIQRLESSLFHSVTEECLVFAKPMIQTSKALAYLDMMMSLSHAAIKHHYTQPEVTNDHTIEIIDGRHPVVEVLSQQDEFIPNDTVFDDKHTMMMITGPNMAGKSTYIRQTALITLMAQMGSFVPASKAKIGVVDQIFTRIGASDDLSQGLSTFMVEMSETANILHRATSSSLVLLDEIGRGTSTYDGMAIAWAVAKHLAHSMSPAPKTLFATHYFELTELAKHFHNVKNMQVKVQELNNTVVFLHKIIQGSADKSYGIHVAMLAGLPKAVIQSAEEKLSKIEQKPKKTKKQTMQLSLLEKDDKKTSRADHVYQEILDCDVNTITPLEALKLIAKWKMQ